MNSAAIKEESRDRLDSLDSLKVEQAPKDSKATTWYLEVHLKEVRKGLEDAEAFAKQVTEEWCREHKPETYRLTPLVSQPDVIDGPCISLNLSDLKWKQSAAKTSTNATLHAIAHSTKLTRLELLALSPEINESIRVETDGDAIFTGHLMLQRVHEAMLSHASSRISELEYSISRSPRPYVLQWVGQTDHGLPTLPNLHTLELDLHNVFQGSRRVSRQYQDLAVAIGGHPSLRRLVLSVAEETEVAYLVQIVVKLHEHNSKVLELQLVSDWTSRQNQDHFELWHALGVLLDSRPMSLTLDGWYLGRSSVIQLLKGQSLHKLSLIGCQLNLYAGRLLVSYFQHACVSDTARSSLQELCLIPSHQTMFQEFDLGKAVWSMMTRGPRSRGATGDTIGSHLRALTVSLAGNNDGADSTFQYFYRIDAQQARRLCLERLELQGTLGSADCAGLGQVLPHLLHVKQLILGSMNQCSETDAAILLNGLRRNGSILTVTIHGCESWDPAVIQNIHAIGRRNLMLEQIRTNNHCGLLSDLKLLPRLVEAVQPVNQSWRDALALLFLHGNSIGS